MSVLDYAVFTDPALLQVSQPGAPSVVSMYITVSNSHHTEVQWDFISVDLPDGKGADALTEVADDIRARVEIDYAVQPGEEAPEFGFISSRHIFRAAAPSLRRLTLPEGGSFTLILENIPVSGEKGLARLKILEKASVPGGLTPNLRQVVFGLPKSTPATPRNFRPDKSLVDADAGEQVTLWWDGPDNLDYWIQYPGGQKVLARQKSPGPSVTQTSYAWSVSPTPKRDTTYTLVAGTTDSAGQPEQGYFLTTTVHVRVPEFESGMRTPWVEGTGNNSRVAFSPAGVDITSGSGRGTVTAATADLNDLVTDRAQVKEHLTLDGGLTVNGRLEAKSDLNVTGDVVAGRDLTVNGDLRPTRNLEVGGAVIAGDLTVRDKLTTDHDRFTLIVHGESLFLGKVNANRHLSVRNKDAWIMHVNDDMVAIQGNLRVHGAFRSDS
ncbi:MULTISPECIES: hypothetical protein [Streptomyces]|uniref:Fibronectin type-III domain-containing protein n=1 Tax=Streptomyces luteosporeus TaxID=173856 RepID=A0ABN3TI96_9ACTN